MGVGRNNIRKIRICLCEKRIEALQKVVADEDRKPFLNIGHRLIWQPDENDWYNDRRYSRDGKPWAEFAHFESCTVDYVGAGDGYAETDDGWGNSHILQVHGLNADGIADQKARGRKSDLRGKEYDELNTHSTEAVGKYLFVRDIFPERRSFPVQQYRVDGVAEFLFEIAFHFLLSLICIRRYRHLTQNWLFCTKASNIITKKVVYCKNIDLKTSNL